MLDHFPFSYLYLSRYETRFMQRNFSRFLLSAFFSFQNELFSKNYFSNLTAVSNSLDPDQAQHIIGPNLHPNCLQRLSADDTR